MSSSNVRDSVDWSVFDQYPEQTVTCMCGHAYRSHAKFTQPPGEMPMIVARKPCGVCGGERMRGAISDQETETL